VTVRIEIGGNLQQTTDNRRVRIYYRFHPLAGQSLWIRERRKGPPATYTVETSSGESVNVPVWMTEESSARLRLTDNPRLHFRKLLELVALIKEKLEPIGCQGGMLRSDQAEEDVRDNQPTPATTPTRPAGTHTTPACRGPHEEHRDHRTDAAGSDPSTGTGGTP